MEVAAKLKFVRLSAQKCRLMCDLIRGMSIERALDVLKFSPKRSAGLLKKCGKKLPGSLFSMSLPDSDWLKGALGFARVQSAGAKPP